MSHFLRIHCKKHGLALQLAEVDILRSPRMDFSLTKVRDAWLSKIRMGCFDLLLTSPPCSTFSRAPWANLWGPRPIRSHSNLRGFTWLKWSRQRMAQLGNTLADFSFEAIEAQLAFPHSLFLKEQPEDLGALRTGPWKGQRPASMWQFEQHERLLGYPNTRSLAIFQSDFGAQYPKPTRLLLRMPKLAQATLHEGLPSFDEEGFYLGPLPKCTSATTTLKRSSPQSPFATSGAAAWPPALCDWIAQSAVESFVESLQTQNRTTPGDFQQSMLEEGARQSLLKEENTSPPDQDMVIKDMASEQTTPSPLDDLGREIDAGGFGPPRFCRSPGKHHLFHDGATLCSPGRWNKSHRNIPVHPAWILLRSQLRKIIEQDTETHGGPGKRCFQMAKIKSQPVSDACLEKIRDTMISWLVNHGFQGNQENLKTPAEGQPFFLGLISHMLRAANDADFEFLKELEVEGATVGVLKQMPRTPKAFEEQTTWRLEDDPFALVHRLSQNYPSVKEHEEWVRQHMEEEVAEGLMRKLLRSDLEKEFGQNIAIASLAVIYDPITDKRRLVHDATHKVRVNHKIKCRDKLRMPGPREKFLLLKGYRDSGAAPFSIIADVSKAHRRFKHRKEEHGLLACQINDDDPFVYVNKVGTFGVSSAAYWWTRLFASVIRLAHYLLDPEESIEALIYADDVEMIAASPSERVGAVKFLSFLTALGTPFKWEKLRGGMATDWIGFHTDYASKQLGLSKSRAEWLAEWCSKVCKDLFVSPSEMASGLGRLGYAANALFWEKPFLGPIYSWSSAISTSHRKMRVPWAIAVLLNWIQKRILEGGRLQPPPDLEGEPLQLFRTDAKAEDGKAWIGGWETIDGTDPKKCRWYSMEVTRDWAPWVWSKENDPGRVIASLELLGTLVAVMVFNKAWKQVKRGTIFGTGLTDNRGNSFVLSKMMSTKYPLTILLIELSEQLRKHNIELHLQWVRREENQEADDLTNLEFSKFDPSLRLHVTPSDLSWLVMPELMKSGKCLYDQILEIKSRKRSREGPPKGHGFKRKRRSVLTPW